MTTTTTIPATGRSPVVPINPTNWSQAFGFDQGQLRPLPAAILTVAGQGPLDASGRLMHEGDPAAQLALAFANVAAVVRAAGLTVADIAQLRIYVTDVTAVLSVYEALVDELAAEDARPPATLVEVSRLAVPGMAVEIDALAVGAPDGGET